MRIPIPRQFRSCRLRLVMDVTGYYLGTFDWLAGTSETPNGLDGKT